LNYKNAFHRTSSDRFFTRIRDISATSATNKLKNIESTLGELKKSGDLQSWSIIDSRQSMPMLGSTMRCVRMSTEHLIKSEPMYQTKSLKRGTRVMLIRNLTPSLVNGTIGVIMDFIPIEKAKPLLPIGIRARVVERCLSGFPPVIPLVKFDQAEREVAIPPIIVPVTETSSEGFVQTFVVTMPLIPAYAFTIHKVQGLTLNHPILVDCSKLSWSCPHLIYVAASRVKKFAQLRFKNLSPEHVFVDEASLKFNQTLPSAQTYKLRRKFISSRASWAARGRITCSPCDATVPQVILDEASSL
jgi:hypothetical protein